MPAICVPALGICALRAVKLDASGAWVEGPTSAAVSNGIISVSVTPEVEEGEQWRQRLPSGLYVAAAADLSQIEAFTYEMEFIQVEPSLFQLMGGGEIVYDTEGNPVGVAIAYRQPTPVYFALEMWSIRPSSDGGAAGGVYSVEPFLYDAVFGSVEYQNEAISFHMTARSAQNPYWGNGPFEVVVGEYGVPSTLASPVLAHHLRYIRATDVAPPDSDCGFTAVGPWVPARPGWPYPYLVPALGFAWTPDPGPLPDLFHFEIVASLQPFGLESNNQMLVSQDDIFSRTFTLDRSVDTGSWNIYGWYGDDVGTDYSVSNFPDIRPPTGDVERIALGLDTTRISWTGTLCHMYRLDGSGRWIEGGVRTGLVMPADFWDGTAPIRIGSHYSGTTSAAARWQGRVYSIECRTGLEPGGPRYLAPIVGTVTTPDPGPMPVECVFVYRVLGPLAAGTHEAIAGQLESSGQYSWALQRRQSDGAARWLSSTNGTSFAGDHFAGGEVVTTAETLQAFTVSPQTVQAWSFADGVWTPRGSTPNLATGPLFDAATVMRIGNIPIDPGSFWDGRIYNVELRTGLEPAEDAPSYLAPWHARAYLPDTPSATITGDCVITAKVRMADIAQAGSYGTIVSHMGADVPNYGWRLWLPLGGGLWWASATNGTDIGDLALLSAAQMATLFNSDEDFHIGVRLTFGATSYTVQAITSPTGELGSWTDVGTVGSRPTPIADVVAPLIVGSQGAGYQHMLDGRIYWTELTTGSDANGGPRFLKPAIGSVTTPDPGPLPDQFVIVADILGPETGTTAQSIAGQWTGPTDLSYLFFLSNSGTPAVQFNYSTTGAGAGVVARFDTVPAWTSSRKRVALAVHRSAGMVRFLRSDGGAAWSVLDESTAAMITIVDTAQALRIGAAGSGTLPFQGRIYSVELHHGLDPDAGAIVWRYDSNEAPTDATTTTWTDARGRSWTVANPYAISGRTIWRFDAEEAPTDAADTAYIDPRGRVWTLTAPNAISGRTLWKFDAEDAPLDATTTSWTDPRGRVWSIAGPPSAISGRTLWRFDASDYPGTGTVYTDPRGRIWTLTDAAAIIGATTPSPEGPAPGLEYMSEGPIPYMEMES